MSYSFLLKGGQVNVVPVPVGSGNNGQSAVLNRKSSSLTSTGVIANGKVTFTIPADRVNEFAGSYTITVSGSVVQSGDIDIVAAPVVGGGGGGNVDLSDYPTKSQVNSSIAGAVSGKADLTYINAQLSTKASLSDLAAKADADALKTVATTGSFADLINKPDLSGFETTSAVTSKLAAKVNVGDVYDKTQVDSKLTAYPLTTTVNSALAAKANSSDVYIKSQVDSVVGTKASVNDVYVKADIDSKLANLQGSAPTNAMVVVAHGGDPNYARPTGASSVYWLGSAQPVNMTSYDLWNDGVTNPPVALVLNGSGADGSATFTINGGDGATEYALYQGSTVTGSPVKTAFPATVTGLTNGTAYTFVAQAKNSMGTVTSNTVTVTPAATATTVFSKNFNTESGANVQNSAPLIDPANAFFYKFYSGGAALALWQPSMSTTTATTYFAWAPSPAPGTAPISNKINIKARSTNTTALWPRVIVAGNTVDANPTEFYAAYFASNSGATTGKWRITREKDGTFTTVATSAADVSFPVVPMDVELQFNPTTGLLRLFVGGSTTPTLSYTDPTPFTGRQNAVAMRLTYTDINNSIVQAVNSFTVKTL
jgi:hypothetical protein